MEQAIKQANELLKQYNSDEWVFLIQQQIQEYVDTNYGQENQTNS